MDKRTLVRRVVIVDDSRTIQAILDNAVSNRADFQVVGFANDAATAAEMVRRLRPDVVMLDLCMPYIDGETLLGMISDLTGVCKVIVSDKAATSGALSSRLLRAGAALCLSNSELINDAFEFFKKINRAADLVEGERRSHTVNADSRYSVLSRCATAGASALSVRYPVPADETLRLDIASRKDLFNAKRERQFDLVTKHVAKVTAFPVCLLTFIDRETQWVKSAFGLDVESTRRDDAFCNYTISQGGAFVVANSALDARFADNPLVTGAPYIRSYTGHAVTLDSGVNVGSLCLIDTRVRTVSKSVLDQLSGMARIVADMIDRRPAIAA